MEANWKVATKLLSFVFPSGFLILWSAYKELIKRESELQLLGGLMHSHWKSSGILPLNYMGSKARKPTKCSKNDFRIPGLNTKEIFIRNGTETPSPTGLIGYRICEISNRIFQWTNIAESVTNSEESPELLALQPNFCPPVRHWKVHLILEIPAQILAHVVPGEHTIADLPHHPFCYSVTLLGEEWLSLIL